MATIRIQTVVTIVDDLGNAGQPFVFEKTISALTNVEERNFAIAADQTRIIWDPVTDAGETMTTFKFLLLAADGNLDVEFTANEANANEVLDVKRVVKGLPLMLGSDVTYFGASGATQGFGGTLDVIDKFRVDEPASVARILKVIMGT